MLNETHDPGQRSWVASANDTVTDFPIQNLPYCVFAPACDPAASDTADWRIGVAIGNQVLDLRAALGGGFFGQIADAQLSLSTLGDRELNGFMQQGPAAWSHIRRVLSRLLRAGSSPEPALLGCLLPQAGLQYRVPARIGDYTDFFTSIHHATRVGQLLRPENPLLPNYKWVPIAYHGRASSIVISGTAIRRPIGQLAARGASEPSFGASGRMDYELELAAYIGVGNALGVTIPLGNAESHVFGFSLLNDWSARDIQAWEAQPLGPFLAKSFATTVSPWIVTMEALEPYRQPWTRPTGDPQPLPYLDDPRLRERGAIDIQMRVALRTEQMRAQGLPAEQISTSNYRDAYWCLAQMVAHHTVAGCNLRPGDLIATGTQSGPELGQSGCLLELTRGGKDAISLASGEQRRFLEDGDEIVMSAFCLATGAASIGFGSCTGTLQAPPGLRAV